MTKQEKQMYLEKDSKGYWSMCGGVEIKDFDYDINDYAIVVINAWAGKKSVHRLKVYYGKRDYITIHGYRLYFDECMYTPHFNY